jgi:large subunit ribosomal protein L17
MRHGVRRNNLGPGKDYRKHLFRSIYHSIITHQYICTYTARLKAAKSKVERLITVAKSSKPIVHKYNVLLKAGLNRTDAHTLINKIAPQYKDRPGGYTRLIHAGFNGAQNPLAILSLV